MLPLGNCGPSELAASMTGRWPGIKLEKQALCGTQYSNKSRRTQPMFNSKPLAVAVAAHISLMAASAGAAVLEETVVTAQKR